MRLRKQGSVSEKTLIEVLNGIIIISIPKAQRTIDVNRKALLCTSTVAINRIHFLYVDKHVSSGLSDIRDQKAGCEYLRTPYLNQFRGQFVLMSLYNWTQITKL